MTRSPNTYSLSKVVQALVSSVLLPVPPLAVPALHGQHHDNEDRRSLCFQSHHLFGYIPQRSNSQYSNTP